MPMHGHRRRTATRAKRASSHRHERTKSVRSERRHGIDDVPDAACHRKRRWGCRRSGSSSPVPQRVRFGPHLSRMNIRSVLTGTLYRTVGISYLPGTVELSSSTN